MAEKANLRRTIRHVGFAPMRRGASESSTTARAFDNIIWFEHNEAGGREYTATANGEMTSIYADGYEVYTSDENHGYDIQLQLLSVIDDIDVMWLGNSVGSDGVVSEFANNVERPRFALIIIEDTADGKGCVHIWYNCIVAQRPDIAGRTSDDSGFDQQFFDVQIKANPFGGANLVYARFDGRATFETIKFPAGAGLASFEMTTEDGTLVSLDQAFRCDVTSYTFSTTATNVVVTEALPFAAVGTVRIGQGASETFEIGDPIPVSGGAISVRVTAYIGGDSPQISTYTFTPST